MAQVRTWKARFKRRMHRYHARRAVRCAVATAFVSAPEPRTIGHFARGRQLIAGNFLFSGHLVEAPSISIWDIAPEDAPFSSELHGCNWLDDLAAVGDLKARDRAQDWVWGWIERYDDGAGPGWTPEQTGRRLIRWINHAIFLLRGQDKSHCDVFYRSLSRQTAFLAKRWKTADRGLPRFEALTGIIYAGLSLEGMRGHVPSAVAALARDCMIEIDAEGTIATRNPEEMMEICTLLLWAVQAVKEAAMPPPTEITNAIERMVPVLRALRHADGGLVRIHGGGRGLEGRLDHALATSGVRGTLPNGRPMGFARVMVGRTTVIADAAEPPKGEASHEAHASTLAFELTSGRRPLIVHCGSGAAFGADWRRAGRATASHSTLGIEGYSSSSLNTQDMLVDQPDDVVCEIHQLEDGIRLEMAHNGWQKTHGLTHARTLDLTYDGRGVAGEDLLTTLQKTDEVKFNRALDDTKLQGIEYSIRFQLHPEVDAAIDLGGAAVSLALKSGEVWIFRHDGIAQLSLAPSVYLESGRHKPRRTQQMVLSGRAMAYATRVRWSLAKAQDTPNSLRDLAPAANTQDEGTS